MFATIRAASDSLGYVTTLRVFGLVTVELFRQLLPNLRFPQQAVDPMLGLQHLLVSETDREVKESPKKKVTTSTVLDQQSKTYVPTLSRSQSIFTFIKTTSTRQERNLFKKQRFHKSLL